MTYLPRKLNRGKDLFADTIPSEEDRKTFMKMLNGCYKYAKAINAKTQPFPSESVIMALLFSQHKIIEWLEGQISEPKINILKPVDHSINEISQIDNARNTQATNMPILLLGFNLGNQKAYFALRPGHPEYFLLVPDLLRATPTYS
jgi:hypothetical protein